MIHFLEQLRYIKFTLILWLIAILSCFLGDYRVGLFAFILSYFFGLHSISTYSMSRIIRIVARLATVALWVYSSLETSNEIMSRSISGFKMLIIMIVISIIIFLFSILVPKRDFTNTTNSGNKHNTNDADCNCCSHYPHNVPTSTNNDNIQINNVTHNY